jgi:hypothetical protein
MPFMPFKANADHRNHIPKQTLKLTHWPAFPQSQPAASPANPSVRLNRVQAVADGWASLNWVAGGCREFVRRVVIRRHFVRLDVQRYVVDDPETIDRVRWEFDGELVLELDTHGKQPQPAQTKILKVVAGECRDIAQPRCVPDRRCDCLMNEACIVREHFEPSLQ